MESITKQLVKIGHGMSKEIAADEPAVAKLLTELASALDVQYERGNALEARCAALAAENAGLKSAIEKHADSYIMCGYCRTERDGKNDDVCEVLDSTPATDAFLAEVRAQGVDELAELNLTLACHEANRSIAESWRESARFAKDHAAQLRKGVQS